MKIEYKTESTENRKKQWFFLLKNKSYISKSIIVLIMPGLVTWTHEQKHKRQLRNTAEVITLTTYA